MANTKPLASQVRYGRGNSTTVDAVLKKSILSFPTLTEAQAAAATLPDGQVVEVFEEDARYEVLGATLEFLSPLPQSRAMVFLSVEEMCAAKQLTVGMLARTLGYFTPGDGGGNDYRIIASGPVIDGGKYIETIRGAAEGLFLGGTAKLEQFGVSSSRTEMQNASAFVGCLLLGLPISTLNRAYRFDFSGYGAINYPHPTFALDLGPALHVFKKFPGIVGASVSFLYYNGRMDSTLTSSAGLGRFVNLKYSKIERLEFQNVLVDGNAGEAQFFGLEYSSATSANEPWSMTIDSVFAKNLVTKTVSLSAGGSPVPMTLLGNYGHASTNTQPHQISIRNFYISDFFSVLADGATITDGDSDVFRLFTNPSQITIENLYARNVCKRFFKSQESIHVTCARADIAWDSRFTNDVFMGVFEAQDANSRVPSVFTVGHCIAKSGLPLTSESLRLFNASGLPHEIYIGLLEHRNIAFYSQNQNVAVDIGKAIGEKLTVRATQSSRIEIRCLIDTAFAGMFGAKTKLSNFQLTPFSGALKTGFLLDNVELVDGELKDWPIDQRVAALRGLRNVTMNFSAGGAAARPFRYVPDSVLVQDLRITDATNSMTILGDVTVAATGRLTMRDVQWGGNSATKNLAFINSGSWSVVLDSTSTETTTGTGIVSKKIATYA